GNRFFFPTKTPIHFLSNSTFLLPKSYLFKQQSITF
ncbi:hypothetical protein KSS87_013481, partial [Heliosperma pusillum]